MTEVFFNFGVLNFGCEEAGGRESTSGSLEAYGRLTGRVRRALGGIVWLDNENGPGGGFYYEKIGGLWASVMSQPASLNSCSFLKVMAHF